MNEWLNQGVVANIMTLLGNSIFGTLKFLYNVIIGYIIAIYILVDKEKFKAQSKKFLYTIFDYDRVNIILENARYTDKIFGGFIFLVYLCSTKINGTKIASIIIIIFCRRDFT